MNVRIARAAPGDLEAWARLRADLWPDDPVGVHRAELAAGIAGDEGRRVGFLATGVGTDLLGFAEASMRTDHVNGCDTSPVAFLEGVYVAPTYRRTGVARALCAEVVASALACGCAELGSDADLANPDAHALHVALGFAATERVVYFRKRL